MIQRLCPLFLVAVLSTGCYVSLQPLGSEEDLVFDRALVGTWAEKNASNKDTWTFKPADSSGKEYEVEITEWTTGGGLLSKQPAHAVKATFKGSLVRIDDMRILDITPGDNAAAWPALGEHGLLMANFVAVHTFFVVRIKREALTLLAIDDAWVDGAIGARKLSIPHEHIGEDPNPHESGETDAHQPRASDEQNWVLLTAPSSQLRALVRHHAKAGLFSEKDPGVFVRQH